MDFDHLRCFQTLAACGSYTAAAKQLFISQPALSYAISQLEARTAIKLFERTARGVRLTPAGEEYLKHVDRAIEELDIGKARARTIAGGASIVRISLMRVLGAIFLPNAITRFKQAFPDEECKFDLRLGIASEGGRHRGSALPRNRKREQLPHLLHGLLRKCGTHQRGEAIHRVCADGSRRARPLERRDELSKRKEKERRAKARRKASGGKVRARARERKRGSEELFRMQGLETAKKTRPPFRRTR